MQVTALLVLEPGILLNGSAANMRADSLDACLDGSPRAFMPVLGRTLIARIAEGLSFAGVHRIEVVSGVPATFSMQESAARKELDEHNKAMLTGCAIQWTHAQAEELWQVAEERFESLLEAGVGAVILSRAEQYFELGNSAAVAAFTSKGLARLRDHHGELDAFWAPAKSRGEAITLLRSRMVPSAIDLPTIPAATYANRLASAADLRRLTCDAFALKLAFRPAGNELRPGVWVGDGATVHPTARIVAPAFIGARTKVRAAALITRGSSIEHHCEVDCGTVVQASNVLPFSYLGAGLELMHCAVGARHIASAAKRRTTEIFDVRLLDQRSAQPAVRLVDSLGKLAAFVPAQVLTGISKSFKQERKPVCTTDVAQSAIATTLPGPAEAALAAGLAATSMTRNHGNE